jgi:hypothetical protein
VTLIGSQSLYSIKTKTDDDDFPDVLLLNDSANSILAQFDSVTNNTLTDLSGSLGSKRLTLSLLSSSYLLVTSQA